MGGGIAQPESFSRVKSPFPGMDPYLERHWLDVHTRLVHGAANAIQRQLTGSLRARIGERLIVEEDWEVKRAILPDVHIVESGRGGAAVLEPPAGVALAEPLLVKVPMLERRERFVQIIDSATDGRVITIIEFISPTNKLSPEGRRLYCEKREEALDAGVSFVEIDLTRAGQNILRFSRELLPPARRTLYLASVWRSSGRSRDQHEVYPIALRERLPAIRIPLRREDRDAVLDLQELLDRAYEEGRYDDIDYRRPLDPALPQEDRAWAAELIERAEAGASSVASG